MTRIGSSALSAQSAARKLSGSLLGHAVRINHELLCCAFVEVFVSGRRFLYRDECRVHGFGDLHFVVENGLHQLAVVAEDRALSSCERVRFGPTQTNTNTQIADLRIGVDASRIACDIESRDADSAAGASDLHDGVEHGSRFLDYCVMSMPASLKSDTIHGRIHLRLTQNLSNLIGQRC